MPLRTLIVDDEPIARQILVQYAQDDIRLEVVATCKNAIEALTYLQQQPIDLLLLDINMPKLSGLELVKSLAQPPAIIFTTAYREYAVDGFELQVVDYLVKPFSFPRFLQAVGRVSMLKQNNSNLSTADDFFFIKTDGKTIKIHHRDILYIEAMSEYVRIHTDKQNWMSLQSLRYLEE